MKYSHCALCRNVVTVYSIVVNIFLVILKGLMGVMSGSAALVADSFHSSADVISSVVTFVSLKISSRPADNSHSYGYGKIQHISSAIVGFILMTGAFFIIIGAVKSIIRGDYSAPSNIAFIGAFISVLCNEMMYRYQSCVARENNSPAIYANAMDNRSDAFSSAAVMVGIIFATFLNVPIADPLAAIMVGFMVIRIGLELDIDAINGLMDSIPNKDETQTIYNVVKGMPAILGISYLRTRSLGEKMYIELNVMVDQTLKVYESDLIIELLKQKIISEAEHVCDIQVFLTPVEYE